MTEEYQRDIGTGLKGFSLAKFGTIQTPERMVVIACNPLDKTRVYDFVI